MSQTVEDATFVANTRLQMVVNMREGRAPEHGIDKERLKHALDLVRKDRSIGAAASGGKGKKAGPSIPIDLGEFMKKKS